MGARSDDDKCNEDAPKTLQDETMQHCMLLQRLRAWHLSVNSLNSSMLASQSLPWS